MMIRRVEKVKGEENLENECIRQTMSQLIHKVPIQVRGIRQKYVALPDAIVPRQQATTLAVERAYRLRAKGTDPNVRRHKAIRPLRRVGADRQPHGPNCSSKDLMTHRCKVLGRRMQCLLRQRPAS